jgi:hypothetical protein
VNFKKGNEEKSNTEDLFISSENYWTEFKDDNFILELNFTTLKVIFAQLLHLLLFINVFFYKI